MASKAQVRSELAAKRRANKTGERIALALRHAGLSSGQLERMLLGSRRAKREAGVVSRWLAAELRPDDVDFLAIANCCLVDVRWLATGVAAPAANAAISQIDAVIARDSVSPEIALAIRGTLLLMEEPDRGSGVCRYCNCTHYDPCPCGCAWVDEAQTICTACLLASEE